MSNMKTKLNRYVKIPSNQGGPFTSTNFVAQFELDSTKVYNLEHSFLEIMGTVSTTMPADSLAQGGAVSKVVAEVVNDVNACPQNIMLVKNANLRSSTKGMLEDIRDVNVLRSTLRQYENSRSNTDARLFKQIGSHMENNNMKGSIFQELPKSGSVTSRNVEAPIRIRMDEIFELGAMQMFPSPKLGRTRVYIELDPAKLNIRPQTVAEMYPSTATEYRAVDDITPGNEGEVTFTLPLLRLMNSPFFVGATIAISATGTGGAGNLTAVHRVITSITLDKNTAKLTCVLNATLTPALNVGETYGTVTAEMVAADSASIVYNTAELVVQEVSDSNVSEMPDQLEYRTWSVEQGVADANVSDFQHLFQVEPECDNMLLMFPNSVYSKAKNVSSWRIRSDGIDKTNRNVVADSPLYYETLNNMFLDANLPLRSVQQEDPVQNADRETAGIYTADSKLIVIPSVLEPTERTKNVQINISSPTTPSFTKYNLYKYVIRNMDL